MSEPFHTFLTDSEVEARWRRKRGYLAELRSQGRGPRFVRLSPRALVHRLSDIIEYEQSNTFASNAAALVAADDNSHEAA